MKRIVAAAVIVSASLSLAPAEEPKTTNLILQKAITAAQSITNTDERARSLHAIAEVQVKAGDFAGATATVGMIEDRERLVSGLTFIAVAQAKAGDGSAAAATFRQAVHVAESLRFAPVAEMLANIAMAQAEAGDRSAAMATLERAAVAAESLGSRPARASSAFAKIAEAQAAVGERAAAAATLDQALAMAARAQSWTSLHEVAKAQLRIGDSAAARGTLEQALDASRLAEVPAMDRRALMAVAETQAEAGDATGASRSLQEARAIAESLGAERRDSILRSIAAIQAGISSASIPDAFPRALATALKSLGGGAAAPGTAPGAAILGDLDAALATVAMIQDPWSRYNALMTISSPWLAAGDHIALQQLMREAALAAQETGNSGPALMALHDLALVTVASGNIDGPLDMAKKIATSGGPMYLAAYIAWAQAEMGDSAAAESTLQTVVAGSTSLRGFEESQMSHLIALAQANTGDVTAALATVERIHDPAMRTDALIAMAADDPPPELGSLLAGHLLGP